MTKPAVMREAEIDLGGTVRGEFSPQDWKAILAKAEALYESELAGSNNAAVEQAERERLAWQAVVRDFHQNRYWGFVADYKAPPPVKAGSKNLGLPFIWMVFNAMVVSKVAILWFGQLYSRTDEAAYKWIFFVLLAGFIANFAYFLWRHRHFPED